MIFKLLLVFLTSLYINTCLADGGGEGGFVTDGMIIGQYSPDIAPIFVDLASGFGAGQIGWLPNGNLTMTYPTDFALAKLNSIAKMGPDHIFGEAFAKHEIDYDMAALTAMADNPFGNIKKIATMAQSNDLKLHIGGGHSMAKLNAAVSNNAFKPEQGHFGMEMKAAQYGGPKYLATNYKASLAQAFKPDNKQRALNMAKMVLANTNSAEAYAMAEEIISDLSTNQIVKIEVKESPLGTSFIFKK